MFNVKKHIINDKMLKVIATSGDDYYEFIESIL